MAEIMKLLIDIAKQLKLLFSFANILEMNRKSFKLRHFDNVRRLLYCTTLSFRHMRCCTPAITLHKPKPAISIKNHYPRNGEMGDTGMRG